MANLTNGSSKAAAATASEDISIGNTDESIDINGQAALKQSLTEEDIEKQKLMNGYREELSKIQEDIATLRLVLNDKLKRENELKQLLGISFVEEIKHDFAEGLNTIKATSAFQKAAQTLTGLGNTVSQNETYQKTTSSLKTATQKVTPAISSIGSTMKSSLGSLRNTSMFKSFEAGFGSTFSSNRMKTSQSEFNVDGSNQGSSGIPSSKTSSGLSKVDAILEEK